MELTFSLSTIQDAAEKFWKMLKRPVVVALHGEMGAGKTTFVHAICDVIGVKDAVGSPTFSLINEYAFQENGEERKLFHLDLYRLSGEAEAVQAGVEDCFYSGHTCFVEWPEKAEGILPENTLNVRLISLDPANRKLLIEDK